MVWKFALRDTAVVALAVAAWWLLAARSASTGPVADATGVVAGALVGAVGFLMHEWGHLLAGLASGGRYPVASDLRSPFLFDIDRSNTVRQFTIMSLGGFAVSALTIAFVYMALPGDLLATRVARGIVVFLAFLTAVLEVPLLLATIVRGEVLEVASVAGGGDAAEASGRGAGAGALEVDRRDAAMDRGAAGDGAAAANQAAAVDGVAAADRAAAAGAMTRDGTADARSAANGLPAA